MSSYHHSSTTTTPNISTSVHIFASSKIKQIWKPLLVGQVLAILLAASGAANDTLHFACNLNAPSLQAGLIYFFIALVSGNILCERRRMLKENESVDNDRLTDQSSSTTTRHSPIEGGGGGGGSHHLNPFDDMDGDNGDNGNNGDNAPVTSYENDNTNSSRLGVGGIFYYLSRSNSNLMKSIFPVEGSLKMYFMMAFLDVEANYFTFLAFRYTTLTSVSLLDALAIPSAMVFSRLMLRRSYRLGHFFGAIICILGVVVNVFVDFKHGNENDVDQDDGYADIDFPNQMRGDIFAILGAIMYGLNDVLTERCVKHIGGVREYQAMIGIFGTVVAFVQGLIVDRAAIEDFFNREEGVCSTSKALSILMVSALFGVASYIGISNFLVESEAAFLNLSLLTGDLWAVGFSIVVQRILPSSLFWVALVLIVVGVFVYELSESPISDDDRDDGYEEDGSDFDHFRSNGLIQQREGVTSHVLQELEMPDEII